MNVHFLKKNLIFLVWLLVLAILGVYLMGSGKWVRYNLPFMKVYAENSYTINVAPYIYGKTPLVSLGEIKNPDNAYINLKFRFRADSTEGYPNVFQTAAVNRGMRMELSGSTAAIIVPDLSVVGGLKGLVLTTDLKTGQWYTLDVVALNGTFVQATLDGRLVADYASAGLSMETSQLLVGGGFDESRNFRGKIENISITKGNNAHPTSEKYSTENYETINIAPYIYGNTPLVSLGAIKNPDNAYINLKFRFRADSTKGYPNVFQTAAVNRGMRMELSSSTAAIIVPDLSVAGGLKGLVLTTDLKTGQWYTLDVVALNGAFVHATLDGRLVADYASAGLSMETSQLLVGGGFDASRNFRGKIENISITKGTPTLYIQKFQGIINTIYAIFVTSLLILLNYYFNGIKGILQRSLFFQKKIFQGERVYTKISILCIGAGFFYYLYHLMVNGYLPSPFVWSKSETFMDLFNPMIWAYNDGRYTDWRSVYPPLSFLIFKLINFIFGGGGYENAAVMRENSPLVIAAFILIYLAGPIIVIKTKLWKDIRSHEKILIYFAVILSTPMLFALERGNLIVLCIVLLGLVLSRIGFLRCLSIALLINIKPYFALLMIYYIVTKNWKEFSICLQLSGLIFVVTGVLLDSHFLVFFINLLNFSEGNGIFSFKEVLALPSSLSAFSYALKTQEGVLLLPNFLSSMIITFLVYVIETLKWGVIAFSLATLIKRSSVISDTEIFALLVVVITNLGVWVGGYTMILYITLIPVFMKMQMRRFYIGMIALLAMPLDVLPLMSTFIGEQYSYLTNTNVKVQWTLGLGSVTRPFANVALLLILSWEFFTRKDIVNTEVLWFDKLQRFYSGAGFYIGLIAVLFAVLLYNGILFNRYFPLTEGWFSAYAHLIRQGLVPYRDFYLFLTPLFPLLLAAFQAIFGESFLALRIFGIGIILLLSLFLYLILVRRFSPLVSLIATVTAIIYYQSGVAHIAYDFIQIFSVFVLAATYLIIRYSDKESTQVPGVKQSCANLLFLSGILVSLAFLTKQSNGTLVVVFSVMAVTLVTARQNLPLRLRNISVYMLGMALPVLIIGIWLYFVNALTPFFDQVVFGAIEAKGSIWNILFSWIGRHANSDYLRQLIKSLLYISPLFLLSILGPIFVKRRGNTGNIQISYVWGVFLFLAMFGVTIGLAYYDSVLSKLWMVTPGIALSQGIVAVSTALAIVLLLLSPMQNLAGFAGHPSRDLAVSSIMTFGLVFGNGTSAGIGEVSVFLSFALALAFLMSLPNVYGIVKVVVSITCLSFILFLANAKFRHPYSWWYVTEPDVRESSSRPSLPLLAGFWLSLSSTKVLEDATRIIQTYSRPDDDVFTFPNIPGFYVLADRWPHSKVVVSWFDFLPDKYAKEEARRLLASPPAIIANLKLPEAAWAMHESLFRVGKPLGQREIQAAILELTEQRKLYQLDLAVEVSPGCFLEIWHKKVQ